jgi:hypothetical protein
MSDVCFVQTENRSNIGEWKLIEVVHRIDLLSLLVPDNHPDFDEDDDNKEQKSVDQAIEIGKPILLPYEPAIGEVR